MATFTWTATGAGTTAWETPAAWFDSTNSSDPTSASFTASPGNDYVINGSNLFTIDNIGEGGTNSPDIANSLTVSDLQANLLLADGHGALDIATTLSLNSLLNLGTSVGDSVLSLGVSGLGGGTISLGSSGRLEGALNDTIKNIGTTPTEIIGSGTIIAEGGIFTIGTSVQVASGDTTKFQIDPNATLSFADAVGGGTVVFSAASGTGVLDVAALSTFNASIKGLFVGTGENDATSYVDFLNVGTTASATLTNITSAGATLTVFTNTSSQTIPIVGNYQGKFVNYVSDGNSGTNVFITNTPCYVAGTAILTPEGEVAVETIQPGDMVMTSDRGRLVPKTVKWAGFRGIDLTRHPRPATIAPIRVRRGALAHELPHRDLLLSPDHCLFIDGGLVPAKLLVNGTTIIRDLTQTSVSYHHIELERHGLLLAEGAAAESYLDTGNRAYFSNAGAATILHPEFAINENLRNWATDACAPLVVQPEIVHPIWEGLAKRAKWLGLEGTERSTTTEPALHLIVDGRTVRPVQAPLTGLDEGTGHRVRFVIPEGAASIRLVSRTAPIEARPWLDDPRLLGVAVRSIMLRDRAGETVVGADHPALTAGWHPAEHSATGAPWRWTAGDAVLPIVSDGPCLLEITLNGGMTYSESENYLAA